jgi:hypothetical protein
MPWSLLARHLAVKAWHRMRPEPARPQADLA